MNVGSLFLSLGIKGDTKSLEDAIKKVEELKKQTQELNKALKETKANSKLNVSTTGAVSTNTKAPKESQILREEAAVSSAKLRIAKTELGFLDLKEKKESKEEREQKKREKNREKATKDFFSQVESGFSFIAKAFTGGLLAGGIGGYVASQAASKVALSASLQQYGIDPEKSQRYANVFRTASNGQVGDLETNAFIANLADRISQGKHNPALLLPFNKIGVDPSRLKDFDSAIKEIRTYSKHPDYNPADITALLGELGLPREFAPAFGKGFSDEQFKNAYDSAKISTNAEVKSAAEVNLKISQFSKALDVLSGTILNRFQPDIEKFLDYIEAKLAPENVKEAAEIAKGIGAGYIATKAVETALKYGKAGLGRLGVVGAGGVALYEGLSYLSDENERLYFPEKYKKRMAAKSRNEKKEESKKSEYVADFGDFEVSDRLKTDPNRVYSQEDIAAVIERTRILPNNNVNTTVNINAGSVDKNTAPFIANEINSNINRSIYSSKYPTLTTPK